MVTTTSESRSRPTPRRMGQTRAHGNRPDGYIAQPPYRVVAGEGEDAERSQQQQNASKRQAAHAEIEPAATQRLQAMRTQYSAYSSDVANNTITNTAPPISPHASQAGMIANIEPA